MATLLPTAICTCLLLLEIDEIYKVSQKKHLLERLNRAIKQNNAQLKKLEDYKELTNAQYSRIMDRIELEAPDLYLYC